VEEAEGFGLGGRGGGRGLVGGGGGIGEGRLIELDEGGRFDERVDGGGDEGVLGGGEGERCLDEGKEVSLVVCREGGRGGG